VYREATGNAIVFCCSVSLPARRSCRS
jgi:hypothetical protein